MLTLLAHIVSLISISFALIHVSLVPLIHGEQKTKPTQASIRDLRGLGLTPDLVSVSSV